MAKGHLTLWRCDSELVSVPIKEPLKRRLLFALHKLCSRPTKSEKKRSLPITWHERRRHVNSWACLEEWMTDSHAFVKGNAIWPGVWLNDLLNGIATVVEILLTYFINVFVM